MSRKVFTAGEVLAAADLNNLVMTPSGVISAFGGTAAPTGYLLCDGSSVGTATYSQLFAVVGYTYGGSGANFSLPNLKGRVPVGRDSAQTEFDTLGETGGAKTHTLSTTEMPSHTHTGTTTTDGSHTHAQTGRFSSFTSHNHFSSGQTGAAEAAAPDQGASSNMGNTGAGGSHSHTFTTASTGGGGAHNNLQPYLVINYIIKT